MFLNKDWILGLCFSKFRGVLGLGMNRQPKHGTGGH